ncbi:hypothetical protein MAN88_22120 [Microcystis aeruginosa]|nr:hypothetical protein MAN88_22120 [Microcystis aeruginosa]
MLCNGGGLEGMKPLYRKTLLRLFPIVFDLERANQLSLLPDKDLVDLCPLIELYQVTKSPILFFYTVLKTLI